VRILFTGDSHGDIMYIRSSLAAARRNDCDRIFVLGDFGYWPHVSSGRDFLAQVDKHAKAMRIEVYFLDGNHDNMPPIFLTPQPSDDEGFYLHRYATDGEDEDALVHPHIHYAPRGHQWNWGGKEFIALGGAYSVDKDWRLKEEAKRGKSELYWFSGEEMTDGDMEAIIKYAEPDKVDVMLAHDKPLWSTPDWNRKNLELCKPNQVRLQRAVNALRPELYLHGHLHYRYSDTIGHPVYAEVTRVEGLDCNPQAAESPNYDKSKSWLVYDTDKGVEEWLA
jgi:Icc-related predicted phosphoesterase